MARTKVVETEHGSGTLRLVGREAPITYAIDGEVRSLKLGPARLRGSFEAADTETAAEAARQIDCTFTPAEGAPLRAQVVGYTRGERKLYVELRA